MTPRSSRFSRLNILTTFPGFSDSAAFLAAEQADPTLLHEYARQVFGMKHTDDHLQQGDTTIRDVATFLESLWNVAMSRMLSVNTPLGNADFGPISSGPQAIRAAHAWVYAPPFDVVDLTVKQQPHPTVNMKDHLPDVVPGRSDRAGRWRAEDFFSRPRTRNSKGSSEEPRPWRASTRSVPASGREQPIFRRWKSTPTPP